MSQPEIHKVLFLSTAHLTEGADTWLRLTRVAPVVDQLPHGYLMKVPSNGEEWYGLDLNDDPNVETCVLNCQQYASIKGCTYIRFDADVEPISQLTTYNW